MYRYSRRTVHLWWLLLAAWPALAGSGLNQAGADLADAARTAAVRDTKGGFGQVEREVIADMIARVSNIGKATKRAQDILKRLAGLWPPMDAPLPTAGELEAIATGAIAAEEPLRSLCHMPGRDGKPIPPAAGEWPAVYRKQLLELADLGTRLQAWASRGSTAGRLLDARLTKDLSTADQRQAVKQLVAEIENGEPAHSFTLPFVLHDYDSGVDGTESATIGIQTYSNSTPRYNVDASAHYVAKLQNGLAGQDGSVVFSSAALVQRLNSQRQVVPATRPGEWSASYKFGIGYRLQPPGYDKGWPKGASVSGAIVRSGPEYTSRRNFSEHDLYLNTEIIPICTSARMFTETSKESWKRLNPTFYWYPRLGVRLGGNLHGAAVADQRFQVEGTADLYMRWRPVSDQPYYVSLAGTVLSSNRDSGPQSRYQAKVTIGVPLTRFGDTMPELKFQWKTGEELRDTYRHVNDFVAGFGVSF